MPVEPTCRPSCSHGLLPQSRRPPCRVCDGRRDAARRAARTGVLILARVRLSRPGLWDAYGSVGTGGARRAGACQRGETRGDVRNCVRAGLERPGQEDDMEVATRRWMSTEQEGAEREVDRNSEVKCLKFATGGN